jgi:nitrate/nitrite-specific signal transduction histidine kinase
VEKQGNDKTELLLRLFEDGKQFTMELMRENERLRLLLAAQKADFGLRQRPPEAAPAGGDAAEQLEAENRRYRDELAELRQTFAQMEAENREFAQKYVDVEQQNQRLGSLYVASYRLHSTLDFQQVTAIIKDIVINLVGSEMFGLFLMDAKRSELRLIDHEGLDPAKVAPIQLGVGTAGVAAETGNGHLAERPHGDEPVACVPLKIQEQVIGMVVIYQLLRQKDRLLPVDFEILTLMADHAATAIYCSQLHAQSERKLQTMQGLLELLKAQ